jgi:hypothetical protein
MLASFVDDSPEKVNYIEGFLEIYGILFVLTGDNAMRKPCCFLFVLLLSGLLLADFNPPQWRGFPGSTYQKWSFSNSDISPIADDYSNPYGMPRVSQPIVGNWIDQSYNGHQGVWFSDTISYLVPNEAEAMNKTRYRVQIIWARQHLELPI